MLHLVENPEDRFSHDVAHVSGACCSKFSMLLVKVLLISSLLILIIMNTLIV